MPKNNLNKDKASKKLKVFQTKISDKIQSSLSTHKDKILDSIQDKIKSNNPAFPQNQTGTLIESFSIIHTNSQLLLLSDAPYAKFLEFGTSKMEAKPFIRPTLNEWLPKLSRNLKQDLKKLKAKKHE